MKLDDNCCGCMQLETGGYIIAWLSIISSILTILSGIVEIVKISGNSDDGQTFALVGVIFAIIFSIIILIVFIILLSGLKTRNSKKVYPAYICLAIDIGLIVGSFLAGFFGGIHWIDLVPFLFGLIIVIYCFIIIRAIYRKFNGEPHASTINQKA